MGSERQEAARGQCERRQGMAVLVDKVWTHSSPGHQQSERAGRRASSTAVLYL